MIGIRSVLFVAVIIIGTLSGGNSFAQTACPAFPRVPWWEGLSHQSVGAIIDRKFGGDWSFYAGAWERQLEKLRGIQAKGSIAIIKNKTAKGRKIRLRGAKLKAYIADVQQRLVVTRCLARSTGRAAAQSKISEPAKAGVCMQCHGDGGISTNPVIPNLAGQNKLYLIKQLKEFQADLPSKGRPFGATQRHNLIMQRQAKNLKDSEVWALATFFADLPACPAGGLKISQRKAPKSAAKCVRCHSPQWNGMLPEVPQLGGQKRQYLLRQLYAFRASAERRSPDQGPEEAEEAKDTRYHFLMSEIAKGLKKNELYELAEYYSGQGC